MSGDTGNFSPALGRRAMLRGSMAAGVSLATSACMVGYGGKVAPPAITGLRKIALSPNGHVVAVEFTDPDPKSHKIALYDWQTGEVTHILHLREVTLNSPCLSPDGRMLGAVRGGRHGDIALINLDTYEITPITVPNNTSTFERFDLRFSPDGRQVIYAEQRIAESANIVLHDIASSTSRDLIDPRVGFYDTSDLCFISQSEIIFQARAPRDAHLAQFLAALGHGTIDKMQYRLRFGDVPAPKFATPELLDPQLDTRRGVTGFFEVFSLSASLDGEVLVWHGFHLGNLGSSNGTAIFERRNGHVTQMIESRGLFACAVSGDGHTIAFTNDIGGGLDFDLAILDRRTGAAMPTNLLAKLRAS